MSDIGGVADGQLLVRYQIGQTQRTERDGEGDRESLVLVHSLGSPARFVPWEIYKRWSYKKLGCSERGEAEERAKHILQTQRFGIQNASEWLEPPKSFSYKARKRSKEWGILQFRLSSCTPGSYKALSMKYSTQIVHCCCEWPSFLGHSMV